MQKKRVKETFVTTLLSHNKQNGSFPRKTDSDLSTATSHVGPAVKTISCPGKSLMQ